MRHLWETGQVMGPVALLEKMAALYWHRLQQSQTRILTRHGRLLRHRFRRCRCRRYQRQSSRHPMCHLRATGQVTGPAALLETMAAHRAQEAAGCHLHQEYHRHRMSHCHLRVEAKRVATLQAQPVAEAAVVATTVLRQHLR